MFHSFAGAAVNCPQCFQAIRHLNTCPSSTLLGHSSTFFFLSCFTLLPALQSIAHSASKQSAILTPAHTNTSINSNSSNLF
jgi:hypothetical protein